MEIEALRSRNALVPFVASGGHKEFAAFANRRMRSPQSYWGTRVGTYHRTAGRRERALHPRSTAHFLGLFSPVSVSPEKGTVSENGS